MKRFFNWLTAKLSPERTRPRPELSQTGSYLRQTGEHRKLKPAIRKPAPRPASKPQQQVDAVELEPGLAGRIEDNGPGKNVLIRNKYVREDTGTHDTLKILDDSLIDTLEETGIDPYNTGQFDRSKNWDKRFRN